MHSAMILWSGKRREKLLVLLHFIVCPIKMGNIKLWTLRQSDLTGKADGTSFKLALGRQLVRRRNSLQPGIVFFEHDTPATTVRGIRSIRFLLRIVEKPQHTSRRKRSMYIVRMNLIQVELRNKRLWHLISFRPLEVRWHIWNPTNPGCPDRYIILSGRFSIKSDRIFR